MINGRDLDDSFKLELARCQFNAFLGSDFDRNALKLITSLANTSLELKNLISEKTTAEQDRVLNKVENCQPLESQEV
jgi:hypothetical protein